MNDIKIQKVKLIKEKTLELSYTKTEADKSKTAVFESHKTEVHKDLKNAFSDLSIHLALIPSIIDPKSIDDIENVEPELYSDFHVSSYSIGGDEEDPGVVLSGHRILKNGKAFPFNTPFTRFEENEETAYKFIDDLLDKIHVVESEVIKYLNGEKKADDPQGKLDFEEDKSKTVIHVLPPESQEEKDEEMLKKLRGNKPSVYADPEAMKRVAEMDNEVEKPKVKKSAGRKKRVA
jgi:hypothetical protein